MKRLLTLLSLLCLIMLAACAPKGEAETSEPAPNGETTAANAADRGAEDAKDADPEGHYPVTVETVDAEGNPVEQTFEKAPERVVAVYQSAIENMLALGLEDRLVLAGQLDIDVKDEWKDSFSQVQYMKDAPSKEAVIAAEPDFIISWSSYFGDKMLGDVRDWHEKGIHTYILKNSGAVKVDSLENEYDDLLKLGTIFDREQEAQKIVDGMKARLDEAAKAQAGKNPLEVAILEIEDENLFRNYGKDTVGGQIAEKAGAELVMDGERFGAEELVTKNPDVIYVVYFGEDKLKDEQLEKLKKNPNLGSLDAIKSGHVYPISLSEVYASGVRTADGIASIIEGLEQAR